MSDAAIDRKWQIGVKCLMICSVIDVLKEDKRNQIYIYILKHNIYIKYTNINMMKIIFHANVKKQWMKEDVNLSRRSLAVLLKYQLNE